MDARNRDELLRKQEKLEAYLLDNPQSELFAWYARQNMEAGELDRALKICRLGMQSVVNKGILHKLMGEIYMAKGDVSQSMQQFVECILTKESFPGVIVELLKNFGETMETEQLASLINMLNKDLPGHPDATLFYKAHPEAKEMTGYDGQYDFLKELAAKLQNSTMVEVIPEEESQKPEAPTQAPVPEPEPKQEVKPVDPVPVQFPKRKTPTIAARPVAVPKRKPIHRQDLAVKHNITRSMATFTLMQIFKSQGMFENALEVLQLLREKSSNLERIEKEEKEIRALIVENDKN